MPAKAGIQSARLESSKLWIPATAGMTRNESLLRDDGGMG
jgi:hypothetical protein